MGGGEPQPREQHRLHLARDARVVVRASADEEHGQLLRAPIRARDAAGGHLALPDADDGGGRLLDLVAVDVVSVEDDHVLAAARDDDLAAVEEGQVAGVQPVPAGGEGRRVRLRVADIAGSQTRGRVDLEPPDPARGHEVAALVDDAQGDAVRGCAGGDEGDALVVRGLLVGPYQVAAQAALEQAMYRAGPVEPAVGDGCDGLGHAPRRNHVPLLDSVRGRRAEEAAQHRQRDPLTPAHQGLEAAEVPLPPLPIGERVGDELVGEGRCPAVLRPVLVEEVEPAQGLGDHQLGRGVDVGAPREDREQVVQQEGAAVVERQPVHHGVVRTHVQDPPAARREVGQSGVREPRGLGRAGAAGRQHQQRGAVRFGLDKVVGRWRVQAVARDLDPQPGRGPADRRRTGRVADHQGTAEQTVCVPQALEGRGARQGRLGDGHRMRAAQHTGPEGGEELGRRQPAQHHGVPGPQAALPQPREQPPCPVE